MTRLPILALTIFGLLGVSIQDAYAGTATVNDELIGGVNFSGAEHQSGKIPGRYGTDYMYPKASSLEMSYFGQKGLKLVRLPFRWERIQPQVMGPLSAFELGKMKESIAALKANGYQVILDLHNYGRFKGKVLGTSQLPHSTFQDIWTKLAVEFKNEDNIWAYGIMNEPHSFPDPQDRYWPMSAQLAVDSIRLVDSKTMILVGGTHWSGAGRWREFNENLDIKDPSNNIRYEAHFYFDETNSGMYDYATASDPRTSYEKELLKSESIKYGGPDRLGLHRLGVFTDWLRRKGKKGFIGEFGLPSDDPRWALALEGVLQEMHDECLPFTYWVAGSRMANYPLAAQPKKDARGNLIEKPQAALLAEYASNPNCKVQQSTSLTVRAKTTLFRGAGATFNVYVNGTKIATKSLSLTAYADYKFDVQLPQAQIKSVFIEFINDKSGQGEDRNLYIENITVGLNSYPSTGTNVVIDKKYLDGKDTIPGRTLMSTNSYMVLTPL